MFLKCKPGTLLCALFFNCVFSSVCGLAINAQAPKPGAVPLETIRTINVCILNDEKFPVREDLIYELFQGIAPDFRKRENGGIEFRPQRLIPYEGDLTHHKIDQAFYLGWVCPIDSEVRMIFSNRFTMVKETEAFQESRDERQLAGQSDSYFGFLVLYRFEERLAKKDAAGNSALLTAFKHEIGHLFGLEHSDNKNSFMYTPSAESLGQWTKEDRAAMRRNKFKRWWPKA